MQYEKLNDSEHPHKVIFTGSEAEIVRAAYREHIYYLAMKGNTGSMEDYEAHISGWEEDGEPRSLRPIRPTNIAEVLDDFADRTEEVIQGIPESTGVPAFQSDDIGERFRLGKMATALAREIRDKTALPEEPTSLEESAEEVTDDAIRQWLDGEQ
jgi:hypothetical protein